MILGKKQSTYALYPLPRKVLWDLRKYVRHSTNSIRPNDRVFPISEYAINLVLKNYCKRAGVEDWVQVSTHRLRAYFATDAKDRGFDSFLIRDLMRHRNLTTTNDYVGRSTPLHCHGLWKQSQAEKEHCDNRIFLSALIWASLLVSSLIGRRSRTRAPRILTVGHLLIQQVNRGHYI